MVATLLSCSIREGNSYDGPKYKVNRYFKVNVDKSLNSDKIYHFTEYADFKNSVDMKSFLSFKDGKSFVDRADDYLDRHYVEKDEYQFVVIYINTVHSFNAEHPVYYYINNNQMTVGIKCLYPEDAKYYDETFYEGGNYSNYSYFEYPLISCLHLVLIEKNKIQNSITSVTLERPSLRDELTLVSD